MILFIGGGKMGRAIVEGLLAQDQGPITVIDPAMPIFNGVDVLNRFETYHGPTPKAVILAVKPQIMDQVLAPIADVLAHCLLISIAAGKTIASFQAIFGDQARIVRAMPNLPAAIGAGMTGWFATSRLTEVDKALTQTILSATGIAKQVESEDQIDAWTAIAGSGPAYLFHFLEAMKTAALDLGFDEETANTLALQTTLGSAQLAQSETEELSFARLRENVTSPGGTTAAGLKVLMPKLTDLMTETTKAALKRAIELK